MKLFNFLKDLKKKKKFLIKSTMNYTVQVQNQVFSMVFVKSTKVLLMELHLFILILSAIGNPTYKVTKSFVALLEPLTYNQYTIKDSFSFCEERKHFNTDLFMVSFDVESLFTKISSEETTDLCVQKLFEDKNYIGGLSKDLFHDLFNNYHDWIFHFLW